MMAMKVHNGNTQYLALPSLAKCFSFPLIPRGMVSSIMIWYHVLDRPQL